MQGGQQRISACFKCGKTDHWSRDCTVPQSEWIGTGNRAPPPQGTQGKENVAHPLPVTTKEKKRVGKPTLTMQLLQDPRIGLPVVFLTFAKRFKKKFKGRGHEASDLRRLLEMYRDWQQLMLPGMDLDQFLSTAEKFGATNMMKDEMRQLRDAAINVLAEQEDSEEDKPHKDATQSAKQPERESGNRDDQPAPEDDIIDVPSVDPPEAGDEAEDEDPFADLHARDGDKDQKTGGTADDEIMDELMDEYF